MFTKQAQKDTHKLAEAGLKPKTEKLIETLREDPFRKSLSYEKLVCDLSRAYSRRIDIHNRMIYQVLENEKTAKIIRMRTHSD